MWLIMILTTFFYFSPDNKNTVYEINIHNSIIRNLIQQTLLFYCVYNLNNIYGAFGLFKNITIITRY